MRAERSGSTLHGVATASEGEASVQRGGTAVATTPHKAHSKLSCSRIEVTFGNSLSNCRVNKHSLFRQSTNHVFIVVGVRHSTPAASRNLPLNRPTQQQSGSRSETIAHTLVPVCSWTMRPRVRCFRSAHVAAATDTDTHAHRVSTGAHVGKRGCTYRRWRGRGWT